MPEPLAFTRRDFLKGTAYGGLGVAMGIVSRTEAAPAAARSRVILVRDEEALDRSHNPQPKALRTMLDQAVCALSGRDAPVDAWKAYFKPDDRVGVKINVMMLPTPRALSQAMEQRLHEVGIAAENIRLTDRDAHQEFKDCTALINTCGLKSHWLSGMAGAVKNYLTCARPSARGDWAEYHGDSCTPVGGIHNLPLCKGKTRLVVIDALRPLFNGGPQVNPYYQWDYKGLVVSTDPVAADTVCLRLLQNKRNDFKGEPWPLSPPPLHIEAAETRHNLGTSKWERIDLVKLGWEKGVLV